MFRALTCPSTGGQIVFTQHLVSSLSVNGCTVDRLRADSAESILWCKVKLRNEKIELAMKINIYASETACSNSSNVTDHPNKVYCDLEFFKENNGKRLISCSLLVYHSCQSEQVRWSCILWASYLDVPGSNLGWDNSYPNWHYYFSSSSVCTGKCGESSSNCTTTAAFNFLSQLPLLKALSFNII